MGEDYTQHLSDYHVQEQCEQCGAKVWEAVALSQHIENAHLLSCPTEPTDVQTPTEQDTRLAPQQPTSCSRPCSCPSHRPRDVTGSCSSHRPRDITGSCPSHCPRDVTSSCSSHSPRDVTGGTTATPPHSAASSSELGEFSGLTRSGSHRFFTTEQDSLGKTSHRTGTILQAPLDPPHLQIHSTILGSGCSCGLQ